MGLDERIQLSTWLNQLDLLPELYFCRDCLFQGARDLLTSRNLALLA